MTTENKISSSRGRLSPPLPKVEIISYFAALIFASAYSIYKVYLCSKANVNQILEKESVEIGSQTWLKDVSDKEFVVYRRLFKDYLVYLAVHFIATTFIKRASKQHLPHMMSVIGVIYLINISGTLGLILSLLQPVAFYFVMVATKSTKMIYLTSLLFLYGTHTFFKAKGQVFAYLASFYQEEFPWSLVRVFLASGWINSRCLSYCLDVLWGEVPKPTSLFKGFAELLSYNFYVPLLIFGPLVNYKKHYEGLTSTSMVPLTFNGLRPLVLSFLRSLFWLLVAELSLYFLYFHGLSKLLHVLNTADSWTVAGIVYLMSQFFNLKYIAWYGVPRAFLVADGIEPPLPTKCGCRIAMYSDMWRYFDNGLYRFIKKYYFSPLLCFMGSIHGINSFIASLITFSFVFLWHGLQENIFLWSACNFAGVTLEAIANWIGSTKSYQDIESRLIPCPSWRRRLRGLVATPLCMASAITQSYFFMGKEATHIVIVRSLQWPELPVVFFFIYCGYQVSVEMRNRDILCQTNKKEKKA